MSTLLLIPHITTGSIALGAGAVALYAAKGGKLHRKAGMLFVFSMFAMAGSGALIAALYAKSLSVIGGVLAFYLVATGLLAVKRRSDWSRRVETGAMLAALTTGTAAIFLGSEVRASATGMGDGLPSGPYFVFGTVALMAGILDARMLFAGGVHGAHRIARHLWRMGFAMFMATASFVSQTHIFPKALQTPAALLTPVILVLAVVFYWLARVLVQARRGRTTLKMGA